MFDMHHDLSRYRIESRQEIVQKGVRAARHPGDLAAVREAVGRFLIAAGERVRGHQPPPVHTIVQTRRTLRPAR